MTIPGTIKIEGQEVYQDIIGKHTGRNRITYWLEYSQLKGWRVLTYSECRFEGTREECEKWIAEDVQKRARERLEELANELSLVNEVITSKGARDEKNGFCQD